MAGILILHTGGTIGMRPGAHGLQPDPEFCATLQVHLKQVLTPQKPVSIKALAPIDSANLQPAHWQDMAHALLENWDDHTGFVILHGTDTLAWSASALSFMLQGADKPVIFTGAQIPLAQSGSDAPANLRLALHAAAQPQLRETCIAFGGSLLRGNRARKTSAQDFAAFTSPNYPALGSVSGDGIPAFHVERFLPAGQKNFSTPRFRPRAVALLPLYPGVSGDSVRALLANPELRAIVLQSYGSGNVPDSDTDFIDSLHTAHARGILLANSTQCPHGRVTQGAYATSHVLDQLGVIPLADMTPEAAHAKLHFLLASTDNRQQIVADLQRSLAGEVSPFVSPSTPPLPQPV